MEPQPRHFQYSLDWRFLLPLTDTKQIGLLLEDEQDFNQTLEQVGIHMSQLLSFADFKHNTNNNLHSFVMPFGVPIGWANAKQEDQVEFYDSLRRLISSGGYLLVGFNNVWNLRAKSQEKYYPSTPRRIVHQLKQAGFPSVKMFGAMPNLAIPEYIFDLDSRAIQFALKNRFRRKVAVLRVLGALSGTIGLERLSNFLPCYFAVATI